MSVRPFNDPVVKLLRSSSIASLDPIYREPEVEDRPGTSSFLSVHPFEHPAIVLVMLVAVHPAINNETAFDLFDSGDYFGASASYIANG